MDCLQNPYDTLRTYQGVLALRERHQERLNETALALGYEAPELQNLLGPYLSEYLAPGQQDLRLLVLLGEQVEVKVAPLPWWQSFLYPEIWPVSFVDYERPDPSKKVWDERKTELREAAETPEVLLVDQQGFIREGSMTNAWFVRKDVLVTPPVEDVLPGVARGLILESAEALGIAVEQRRIAREEFESDPFDAVFLTSSVRGIVRTAEGPLLPLVHRISEWCTAFIKEKIYEAH